MSDKRIRIPSEMRHAAFKAVANKHGVSTVGAMAESWADDAAVAVEAALLWLSEHPIVPTNDLIGDCYEKVYGVRLSTSADYDRVGKFVAESQRRMFLSPQPEIQEEIADLLWDDSKGRLGEMGVGRNDRHNALIVEAFNRGKAVRTK